MLCKQSKSILLNQLQMIRVLMVKRENFFPLLGFKMTNIETIHWKFVVVSEPVELTKEEELHMKLHI